jgi:hypothetical protein
MILAYSVALRGNLHLPAGVDAFETTALQCCYAERVKEPGALEVEVRAFFEINQSLFAQADIIEFRYPTLLPDTEALKEFLARHEPAIVADLRRLQGLAQVAVYLPKEPAGEREKPRTGTEYLQGKRERSAAQITLIDEVRALAGSDLRDSVVQGDRLLLLVPRAAAATLMRHITAESRLEVAGHFPPSGFAKLLS